MMVTLSEWWWPCQNDGDFVRMMVTFLEWWWPCWDNSDFVGMMVTLLECWWLCHTKSVQFYEDHFLVVGLCACPISVLLRKSFPCASVFKANPHVLFDHVQCIWPYIEAFGPSGVEFLQSNNFPLLVCILLIAFSFLIALAKTSSTVLYRYGESGQHCLVLDFNGIALSFSLVRLILTMELL